MHGSQHSAWLPTIMRIESKVCVPLSKLFDFAENVDDGDQMPIGTKPA